MGAVRDAFVFIAIFILISLIHSGRHIPNTWFIICAQLLLQGKKRERQSLLMEILIPNFHLSCFINYSALL